MELGVAEIGLVLIAGFLCGFITTVASSGSAVSLPILLAIGLDPITANATNRLPVIAASLTAVVSYHRNRAIDWGIAIKAIIPSTIGAIFGALAATMISAHDFKLVIAGAVLVALFLLFFRLRTALNHDAQRSVTFGLKQYVIFFLIGLWLGFIVLDGATFLLLALTVSAGVGLVAANAIKSAIILPSVLASMLVFSYESVINWQVGLILAMGSIFGGFAGARLAMAPAAKKAIFWMLAAVLTAEAVHLAWQFATTARA
jgi:uncharacterized membrane protein YfcA